MNGAAIHPRLIKARAALVMSQPFFGALALGLRVEEANIDTMDVDGRTLRYGRAFVDSLDDRQLQGTLAHEVMHCAYLHHTRRKGRDLERWNIATDYTINRDLLAAGFKLPDGILIDHGGKRFGAMGAEEIYRTLEREGAGQKPQPGQGAPQPGGAGQGNGAPQPGAGQPGGPGQGASGQSGGQGAPSGQPSSGGAGAPGQGGAGDAAAPDPGKCGGVRDAAPEHDAAANSQAEAEWSARVRQAIAVAKAHGHGKVPAALESLVAAINAPVIDWRAVLRRFVDESASRDYSWLRPNRRHIAAGRIFPGYVPDRPSHLVAMVDTSGSISTAELESFAAELQSMLDEGAADRITVAYADTDVRAHEEFDAGEVIAMRPQGGGGTRFSAPLAWIGEHVPDASAVVYMTDCEVSDWGEQPGAPLLWLVTGAPSDARRRSARAPFGEAIILAD